MRREIPRVELALIEIDAIIEQSVYAPKDWGVRLEGNEKLSPAAVLSRMRGAEHKWVGLAGGVERIVWSYELEAAMLDVAAFLGRTQAEYLKWLGTPLAGHAALLKKRRKAVFE